MPHNMTLKKMPFGKRSPFRPPRASFETGNPFLPLKRGQQEVAENNAETDNYIGMRGGKLVMPGQFSPGKLAEFKPDVSRIGKPHLRETAEQKAARRKVKSLNFAISFTLRLGVFFAMMSYFNTHYVNSDPSNWFLIMFGLFLLDCFRAVNKAATPGTI